MHFLEDMVTVELERLRLSQNDYGLLSLLRLLNLLAHSRTSLVRSEAINGSCSRRRRSRLHRRRCPRPPTETRPWDGQTFQMHSNTVYWQWTPFFFIEPYNKDQCVLRGNPLLSSGADFLQAIAWKSCHQQRGKKSQNTLWFFSKYDKAFKCKSIDV